MAAKKPGTANAVQPSKAKPAREGKFDFLIKSKLVPKQIMCRGYGGGKMGVHPYDASCHTKLPYNAQRLMPHVAAHGGGFEIKVAHAKGAWKGWQDLSDMPDIVINDFRCGICEQVLSQDHGTVLAHMQVHQNTHRRMEKGGKFLITLKNVDSSAPIYVDPEDELDDVELIEIN